MSDLVYDDKASAGFCQQIVMAQPKIAQPNKSQIEEH
jgi:hypothetical protein